MPVGYLAEYIKIFKQDKTNDFIMVRGYERYYQNCVEGSTRSGRL